MKLSDLYGAGKQYEACVVTNIDDIVREVRLQGVKEVEVTTDEMFTASRFMLASGLYGEAANKALLKGEVDEMFGVKLHKIL